MTSSFTILVYLADNTSISISAIYKDDYLKSNDLKYTINDITFNLETLLKFYKSEDYIKSGGTLNKKTNFPFEYSWELTNLYNDFKDNSNEYYDSDSKFSKKELLNKFETSYAKEIELYRNKYITDALNNYTQLIKEINNIDGLYYYISSEEYELTNSPNKSKDFFASKPVYKLFDKDGYLFSSADLINKYYSSYELNYYPQDILYIALDDTFLNPRINQWNEDREVLLSYLSLVAFLMLGVITCIVYLIICTGRKANDNNIHLSLLDKLYIDVNIFTSVCLIAICFGIIHEIFSDIGYSNFIIPFAAIISTLSIIIILTITKHIKNKTIIKHNMSYKFLRKMFSFIIKLFNNLPVAMRMIPSPKKATDLKNIIEGVDRIKNGELDYVIETSSHGLYSDLAKDINGITSGLKSAVNNKLKSERLKTELISNVSHDIRTPLTSIINYVDLLKREGTDSENAEKYLTVLEQKSQRLKTLTDDLFEASKASSGDIPVNLSKVDISSLLIQCMGEL